MTLRALAILLLSSAASTAQADATGRLHGSAKDEGRTPPRRASPPTSTG